MSTFDAGSIESQLVLDRSDFTEGLRLAKAEGENFSRLKFTATADIDGRGGMRTIAQLRAELASLRNVDLKVGVTGSNAQIRSISQSASALDGRTVRMSVEIDGIAAANAQLRTLTQQVRRLDGHRLVINADLDTAGALTQLAALRAELSAFSGETVTANTAVSNTNKSMGFMRGHMADIIALALLALPAIIPLTGALLAEAGAFTTLGVAAAGAAGIFGLAVFGAVKQFSSLNKELTKAQKNLDTQKKALDQLKPGTDAYARQLEKVEQAQKDVNAAQAKFSPEQRRFQGGITAMQAAWTKFIQATQGATLPFLITGMHALAAALPKLVPAVRAVAPLAQEVATAFRGWVDTRLQVWVAWLATTGVVALHSFIAAGRNIGRVFGSMFNAFTPMAGGMAKSIENITDKMARWAEGGGFQSFLLYVKSNGPAVHAFMVALGHAFSNIFQALKGLGPLSLGFVTILLQLVAALPVSWIQAIYLGFIAWRAALLGIMIISAIIKLVQGFQLAWQVLNFVFAASPIGVIIVAIIALIAIFVLLWLKCEAFRNFWKMLWEYIKIAALAVWNSGLKPAFNGIMTAIREVGKWAMWLWTHVLKPTWNFISTAARVLFAVLFTVLFTPFLLYFKIMRAYVMAWWNLAIKPVFHFVAALAMWLWNVGIKPYFHLIQFGFGLLVSAAKLWWKGVVMYFHLVVAGAKLWWHGVMMYFHLIIAGLQLVGKWTRWLWDKGIHPAFNAIAAGAKWLYNKGVKPPVDLIVGIFKTMGGWAKWLWDKGIHPFWNKISDGTDKLKDAMVKIFGKMKDGIAKMWNAIKKIAAVPINFVIDTVYNNGVVKVWNKIAHAVGLDKMKLGSVSKIKYAQGGRVNGGYGLSGQDSVAIQANPNEHVWTADEVRNFGGHGAMAAFRSSFSSTGKARVGPGAGTADYSRGPTRYMLGGGIIDWTKDTVGDAAGGLKGAWDATGGRVVSGALNALKDVARGAIGSVANPILKGIKGGVSKGINAVIPGSPDWEKLAAGTATKPIDMLIDWINADDAANALGGANVSSALKWARTQNGKPYQWGGNGNPSWDCSGFMSAIESVIRGEHPHRRWATSAFSGGHAPSGWQKNLKSPFMIGVTNAGVGHTAGTLAGVNVESASGGVHVGGRARGYSDHMFPARYGFKGALAPSGGGAEQWRQTTESVLRELGLYSGGNVNNVLRAIQKESGGNPRAVNNWDSNAKAGHPSKGLLQVIASTFNAYAGKYRGKGQYDPYANIYAGVNYAHHRYGGGWSARMARPGGYQRGGVTVPGVHLLGEAGPELVATSGNDRVFTASETERILAGVRGGDGSSAPRAYLPGMVTLRVGDHEFDAYVDSVARDTITDVVHEAEGQR